MAGPAADWLFPAACPFGDARLCSACGEAAEWRGSRCRHVCTAVCLGLLMYLGREEGAPKQGFLWVLLWQCPPSLSADPCHHPLLLTWLQVDIVLPQDMHLREAHDIGERGERCSSAAV